MTLKSVLKNLWGAILTTIIFLLCFWIAGLELSTEEKIDFAIAWTAIIYTVFSIWDFAVFLYKTVT